MFECPECYGKTQVIITRYAKEGAYRRRKCTECGMRFSTIEAIKPDGKYTKHDYKTDYIRKLEEQVRELTDRLEERNDENA